MPLAPVLQEAAGEPDVSGVSVVSSRSTTIGRRGASTPPARCRLPLPAELLSAALAREIVRAVLTGNDAAATEVVDDVVLVVSELVTNAVRHANGPIVLEVQRHSDGVEVGVEDASPVLPHPRSGDEEGGRGLPIVDALASCWGVHNCPTGKRVWARFTPSI